MKNKNAFKLSEIIVSFFILLLVIVISYSFWGAKKQNSINSLTISDLEKLNNAIINYKKENLSLPIINGNKNFYNKNGDYLENVVDSFGVNGFIGQNFLSKKYIEKIPFDIRTNQNYAFGKTSDNSLFQISGVNFQDGVYISKTIGNYDEINNSLHGLIREYNGPNFVYNNSYNFFPYNPLKKELIAKINNYKGKIKIISKSGKIIEKPSEIYNYILKQGDKIITDYSSKVTIFFSDGSHSVLEENSGLELTNMEYPEKNTLFSRILLTLNSGTLWTKASKLGKKSAFEINTDDNVASIRGTIFAVQYRKGKTNLTIKEGEIKIKNGNKKILKKGEFIGNKIEFHKFEVIKKQIIYNPKTNTLITNGF